MGCFSSRFDKRKANCTDLNTVAMQFVGGEAHQIDWCPVDKVVTKYGGDALEELPEHFKVTGLEISDLEMAQKIGIELHGHLKDHVEALKKKFGEEDQTKPSVLFDKYPFDSAIEECEAAIKHLVETAEVKVGGGEDEKKEDAEGG